MREDDLVAPGEETGYYEVALSNRQLLGAFCLFSVVLAGAFLMGVWFAREGQALGPARAAAPPPRAAEEDLAGAGAGAVLDEMKFFSEEPRAGAVAPAPAAVPTPAPPPPPIEPAPAPRRAASGAATVSAPAGAGALHVQVFSSPDANQARRVLDQLKQAGYTAALSPIEVGNRTMHRVRVGPFRERAEAERIAAQVKERFRLATWITSY